LRLLNRSALVGLGVRHGARSRLRHLPWRLSVLSVQTIAQRVRRRCLALSPTDALVHLKVRCRLWSNVPIRLDLAAFTRLHIACIPQRRPARWSDAGRLTVHPDVVENVSDVRTVRDEGL
jgi:hypothetical protein